MFLSARFSRAFGAALSVFYFTANCALAHAGETNLWNERRHASNGVQLARAVEALLPGTPVLVVSGYAEQEVIDPDLPLLSKPFRNSDLAQSITAIL